MRYIPSPHGTHSLPEAGTCPTSIATSEGRPRHLGKAISSKAARSHWEAFEQALMAMLKPPAERALSVDRLPVFPPPPKPLAPDKIDGALAHCTRLKCTLGQFEFVFNREQTSISMRVCQNEGAPKLKQPKRVPSRYAVDKRDRVSARGTHRGGGQLRVTQRVQQPQASLPGARLPPIQYGVRMTKIVSSTPEPLPEKEE